VFDWQVETQTRAEGRNSARVLPREENPADPCEQLGTLSLFIPPSSSCSY